MSYLDHEASFGGSRIQNLSVEALNANEMVS